MFKRSLVFLLIFSLSAMLLIFSCTKKKDSNPVSPSNSNEDDPSNNLTKQLLFEDDFEDASIFDTYYTNRGLAGLVAYETNTPTAGNASIYIRGADIALGGTGVLRTKPNITKNGKYSKLLIEFDYYFTFEVDNGNQDAGNFNCYDNNLDYQFCYYLDNRYNAQVNGRGYHTNNGPITHLENAQSLDTWHHAEIRINKVNNTSSITWDDGIKNTIAIPTGSGNIAIFEIYASAQFNTIKKVYLDNLKIYSLP